MKSYLAAEAGGFKVDALREAPRLNPAQQLIWDCWASGASSFADVALWCDLMSVPKEAVLDVVRGVYAIEEGRGKGLEEAKSLKNVHH